MSQQSYHELIYQPQDDVEDLEGYQLGGYHPVKVGDVYSDERYTIVHKLGWGSYSTVWLARDAHSSRYVALKVIVADESKDNTESRILRHLDQIQNKKFRATGFVSALLDEFYIRGPNGDHLCLVTELARCSVASSKAAHPWTFPLHSARAIAAQAILGLQEIHGKGVVHGDLHPRNILFALPEIDSMSVEEIYKNFNRPQETKVCRVDGGPLGLGVPSHTVVPASVVIPCHKVQDPRIRISDFGGACLMTDKSVNADLQIPVLYLPPEAILATKSVGFPADIWTLACSIYEIMGDTTLFSGFYPDKEDIVAEMISCLGLLPHDWWKIWGARGEFFEEDGSWRAEMDRAHDSKSRPLSQRIREMGRENDREFSTEEAKYLEQMLETMLQYKPEDRATIEDVMKSEWMTRWGMPSLEIFNITVPYEP